MESKRQNKFSRLLQRDLGDIFQKDIKGIFDNAFITVTQVKVSPDLGVAKIYLSFLNAQNADRLMYKVNLHKGEIRKALGNRISKQVKKIPELIFFHDDSAEYAAHIDKILSGLHIPPPSEEENNDGD
ncbi:MAG: 30S ribosome-binding factor RbfA [Cyclobacteriaceae bacterium]